MKVWVIGRGGLLGNSVEKQCRYFAEIFSPSEKFAWSDSARLDNQITESCRQFSQVVVDSEWAIFWCAGKGTLSSTIEQMAAGNESFSRILKIGRAEFQP
ncbi:hypothetical protein EMGBS4_07700 [Acidimicrobiaceae bacterium]|nr:hypothetical protein EMGBS4_07700 [Acidimicrobiaceae bacterium]